jgi:hypothetical protein
MFAWLETATPMSWLRVVALAGILGGMTIGVTFFAGTSPAHAQGIESDLQTFDDLTRLPEIFDVMRLEGLENDRSLGEELFGNPEDPTWLRALDKVYSTDRMTKIYSDEMRVLLAADPLLVADVSVFLGSELGKSITGLELEARRTALDPMAMGAAREVYAEILRQDKDRTALIERLVDAADLVDSNVSNALNANVAFARAMAAAGNFGGARDEEALLADVWAREPDIRAAVVDYIYPLMALAYSPLSNDELTAYVNFFESDAGQRYNTVLIRAFEPVMIDLSQQLGAEAGRLMSGQVL